MCLPEKVGVFTEKADVFTEKVGVSTGYLLLASSLMVACLHLKRAWDIWHISYQFA